MELNKAKMELNKAIKKCLTTWYPVGHPLHLNPLHPALGLAGEAGELLNLWKKHMYKPGFDWWQCHNCGELKKFHRGKYCRDPIDVEKPFDAIFAPMVLIELGDWWYYWRILAYQTESLDLCLEWGFNIQDIGHTLAKLNQISALVLSNWIEGKFIDVHNLGKVGSIFKNVLQNLDVTLDTITDLNYQKLNSDPTYNGWIEALKND